MIYYQVFYSKKKVVDPLEVRALLKFVLQKLTIGDVLSKERGSQRSAYTSTIYNVRITKPRVYIYSHLEGHLHHFAVCL